MNKAVIRGSERIYDFLLKFYPKKYRQEFEEEMKYVFSESLKDVYSENGEQGIFAFWTRTMLDAGKSLVTQHVENQKGDDSMKSKSTHIMTQNKDIIGIVLAATFILLLPLLAMQFTDEVAWDLTDFATAGSLLFGTGFLYVLASRKTSNIRYRVAIGVAFLAALLLVWIELAVGIFN